MEKFKMNALTSEQSAKLVEKLQSSEDKSAAILEVLEEVNAIQYADLIAKMQAENEQIKADSSRAAKLGIRTSFTAEEKKFLEMIKRGARQTALTVAQDGVFPSTMIDRLVADVEIAPGVSKIVNFAPAGVGEWLTGSHTAAYAWGALTGALTAELTASINVAKMDLCKLSVFMLVPKAVRDLEIGVVDKYVSAVLMEGILKGVEAGVCSGTGSNQPIGLLYKLPAENGTISAQTVHTDVTGFGHDDLQPVLTTLANGNKRAVNKLYVLANPTMIFQYINKALYYFNGAAYVSTCPIDIEVIPCATMADNKAIFTLDKVYTMGFSGIKTDEYKETKAIEDCDLFVAKVYANGRPDDDNCAYVFNPANLTAYIPTYQLAE